MADNQHHQRMRSLVEFTATSFESDHPSPFGAAIYDVHGKLLARAFDTVMQAGDPTRHGEINAIREATRTAQQLSLRNCVLYSTCEPCPMCMSACIWAEIDVVVYGASTMHDAHPYWPQASDLPPHELVERMLREPRCSLIPHVERQLCQQLFQRCDEARRRRNLQLPPHR